MKRTTIFLDPSMELDLKALAYRKNEPVSHLVREAIARYVASEVKALPLPSWVGSVDSGYTDTAERHEELLFEGLEEESGLTTPPPKGARRSTTQKSKKR